MNIKIKPAIAGFILATAQCYYLAGIAFKIAVNNCQY